MKNYKLLILFPLILVFSSIGSAFADDEILEQYMSQCNAPAALYDPEVMAKTMMDPDKFLVLLGSISKPSTTMTMYECIANQEQFETVIKTLSNPEKLSNSASTFMTPEAYAKWITALQDPETQQALLAYMNPELYLTWMSTFIGLASQHYNMNKNN
ncbi:MAG: hypothetical protein AAF372_02895 [Pseudomonadota bacterium]